MKYLKLTPEMIDSKYDVNVDVKDTVMFQRKFIEFKGKKYICTKIGNAAWETQRVDDFPFVKWPKELFKSY